MAGIKRWPADIIFSTCIRERSDWTCERCDKQYPEGHRGGLECSHYWGRAIKSTRWNADNCFALCTGCHALFTGRPEEHVRWVLAQLGDGLVEILRDKQRELYKGWKRDLKDIRNHYKAEFTTMEVKRADGVQGRIEFQSWN